MFKSDRATKLIAALVEGKAMVKFAKFDAAEHLDNEETVAESLSAALENENPEVLSAAIHSCKSGAYAVNAQE